MNLIYFCVFNNSKYLDLAKLLLNTIKKYSKIKDHDIKLLIYTSTEFKNIILNWDTELIDYFKDILVFEISDTKNTTEEACYSRLEIFDLETIKTLKPEKILYIDTDVFIVRPIQEVFNNITEDKIYAKKEGNLWWLMDEDIWGRNLFGDRLAEIANEDETCFCSGVLGFTNSEVIRNLFVMIRDNIRTRNERFCFMDQPYIVYTTKLNRLLDNNKLDEFIFHNSFSKECKKATIIHFNGNERSHVGQCDNKYNLMKYFTETLDDRL